MRGRKPLPNEIHALEKGKLYGALAARVDSTPKPKRDLKPRCPRSLSVEERKVWRNIAAILKNYNLFTVANAPFIEFLAADISKYRQYRKKVDTNGETLTSENGTKYRNPEFDIMNKYKSEIRKSLSELGLSSTGLARIGSLVAGSRNKKSEMEELID